jgi:DNA-binding transcriptional LysR family regulator
LDAISDFALFRAIVDAGGISAAALVLQSSPAAVSRRLTALEAKLGVRLADRSSRRFRLTDEGLLLYERSRSILEQIRDAEAEVASRGGAARGLLKVGAPSDFGRRHLGPILALFTAQHSGLETHLVLSDAGLENQADGLDLVLRFGLPNDPGMIARKIAMTSRVLCAAPSYLTSHGTPNSPDDLLRHNVSVSPGGITWMICGGSREMAASLRCAYEASFPAETVPFCTSGRFRVKAYRGRRFGTFQTIWLVAGLYILCRNIRVLRWSCTPFLRPASRCRLVFVCL